MNTSGGAGSLGNTHLTITARRCARYLFVEHLAAVAGTLVFIALWATVHVTLVPYLAEDSYIHFRVAEHLVHEGHPYFNTGEAVKTSSSTPWTLFLAAQFWFAPRNLHMLAVSASLISAFGALCFVALHRAVGKRKLKTWEVGIIVAIYLAVVQAASVTLMETGLALSFATAGLYAFFARKPCAMALFALAAWTRPELSVLMILATLLVLTARALPRKASLLCGLAVVVPACALEVAMYGTIVPHAAVAKAKIHTFRLDDTYFQLLPQTLMRATSWNAILMVGAGMAYLVLATLPVLDLGWSCARLREPSRQVLLLSTGTGLVVGFAYLCSHGLIFPWYRALYLLFFFVPALLNGARTGRWVSYVGPSIGALPLLWDLGNTFAAAAGKPELASHFLEGARARRTVALAEQLYTEYPNATLLTAEIGAAGYGFRGTIVDAVGIASPSALRYHPLPVPQERHDSGQAPIPRKLVQDLRPGLILSVDRHVDAVFRDPVIADYVHLRESLYEDADEARRPREDLLWYTARYLDVLVRRDLWEAHHSQPLLDVP